MQVVLLNLLSFLSSQLFVSKFLEFLLSNGGKPGRDTRRSLCSKEAAKWKGVGILACGARNFFVAVAVSSIRLLGTSQRGRTFKKVTWPMRTWMGNFSSRVQAFCWLTWASCVYICAPGISHALDALAFRRLKERPQIRDEKLQRQNDEIFAFCRVHTHFLSKAFSIGS